LAIKIAKYTSHAVGDLSYSDPILLIPPVFKLFYSLLSINQRRRRTSDHDTFAGGIIFVRYRSVIVYGSNPAEDKLQRL